MKNRKRTMPVGLILYLPEEAGLGEKLLSIIQSAVPGHKIERCHSIEELTGRLHQPICDVGICVLYAASRADLMEMIYLSDMLGELRVVLVLPDNQPEMLEKAHRLRPRFIVSTASDLQHLEGVLRKLIDIYEKTHSA
ncbi:MAG: hypothetical protein K4571_02815 [Deltaproteobacteria bacterium]